MATANPRASPASSGVPIVFLTTESDDALKAQAKQAGATGWMVKPLKPDQLLAIMRKIVWTMEKALPHPPATLHQLDMLAFDNVTKLETVERVFSFKPRPLEGNIDYIRPISRWAGLRIALGFMPKRIRDH